VTYAFGGNDPNKQRVVRSPEEVKAMLTGGGSEGPLSSMSGVDVDTEEGLTYIHDDLMLNAGFERCLGCGMPVKSLTCWCGSGCKQCWGPAARDHTTGKSL
jgi:hypothetical protein